MVSWDHPPGLSLAMNVHRRAGLSPVSGVVRRGVELVALWTPAVELLVVLDVSPFAVQPEYLGLVHAW